MDPAVSRSGQFACASCHDPEHGFSDPRRLSADENGQTRRHSQPLHDLAAARVGMHWDGEFDTVRDLLTARLGPLPEALNIAITSRRTRFERARARGDDPDQNKFRRTIASLAPPYYGDVTPRAPRRPPVEVRLQRQGRYAEGFRRAFGSSEPRLDRVIDALEAYVLSIRSTTSRYDRYLAGDPEALDAQERRGLRLFNGKANCATCHTSAAVEGRVRFTDGRYHNTGVTFANLTIELDKPVRGDGGFGELSFVAADLGRFKTPSLRDVAARAPYMHDGSLATLEEVVRYYDKGGTPNRHLDRDLQPLHLEDREVADLVAFLRALSGERRAGLGELPRHRARRTRIRIRGVDGDPLRNVAVVVVGRGDRLGAGSPREPALRLQTTSEGRIEFPFPAWTHVRLEVDGYRVAGLLPDYTATAEVTAVPSDRMLLHVRGPGARTHMPARITAWQPDSKQKNVFAVFKRMRRLKANEAFYVAPVPEGAPERVLVHLDLPGQGRRGAQDLFEIFPAAGVTGRIEFE